MTRERSIDLFILTLNVVAIMVLVGILSVMVNTADAAQSADTLHRAPAAYSDPVG